MNDWIRAGILGFIQGLTEFLPVSSSGHLVIFQNILGMREPELLLDTILHLGTLAAAVVFLWPQLREILDGLRLAVTGPDRGGVVRDHVGWKWIRWTVIATIPTALIGLTLEDTFEALFGSVTAVGFALCVTGVVLIAAQRSMNRRKPEGSLTAAKSVLIGLAQGIAITPGISRSGSTICAGIFAGVDIITAARFSFLLSIPAILGALVLQLRHWDGPGGMATAPVALGFAVSAATGYAALRLLFNLLEKRRFHIFGYYCLAVGVAAALAGIFTGV